MKKSADDPQRTGASGSESERTLDPIDSVALAHLWASQFQHLTTLGVAGAGGVLILLQAGMIDPDERWWLAVILFAITSTLSMYGQIAVVDEASEGRLPGRRPRSIRGLALAVLGAGAGAALSTMFR